jgi:hypothetical protein
MNDPINKNLYKLLVQQETGCSKCCFDGLKCTQKIKDFCYQELNELKSSLPSLLYFHWVPRGIITLLKEL